MKHEQIADVFKQLAADIRQRVTDRYPGTDDLFVIVSLMASSRADYTPQERSDLRATVYHDRFRLANDDSRDAIGVEGPLENIADRAVEAACEAMDAATDKARRLMESAAV